jgi:hypothetical protein
VKQTPGSYITINRKWSKGDRIEATFPMHLWTIPANDNPDKVALAYGPLVLAGQMGVEGIPPYKFEQAHATTVYLSNDCNIPLPYQLNWDQAFDGFYDFNIPDNLVTSLRLDRDNLNKYIRLNDKNKLTFEVANEKISLAPIYTIYHQRYVTYFDIKK